MSAVRTSAALLERASELDAIEAGIAAARGGAGGVIVIEGPPGVGKTRLLRAATERARELGLTVLFARGSELEGEFAWGVVHQLFERPLSGHAGEQRDPQLGDAGGDDPDALFSTLHGLYRVTIGAARRGPLLIAVDDVQWADAPSLRFLTFLAARLERLPVLVALTARERRRAPTAAAHELVAHLGSNPLATTLRPEPLSPAASAKLVRAELGGDAAEEFCAACHETTGGNPFLLGELVRELIAEGVAPTADAAARVRRTTPEVVRRSVLLRLARVPPEALAMVRAAAVLGPGTDLRRAAVLAAVEQPVAAAAAHAAIDAAVLEDESTLDFVHPILRAAVLDDLSALERARWHDRAARLLADEGASAGEVASHLLATPPAADEWVVEMLREAAAFAQTHAAPEAAVAYLRRALREPPTREARVRVLQELGVAEAADDPAAACRHLREALELATGPAQRAAIALELGRAMALFGRFAEAAEVLGDGLDALGGDGSALGASLEAELLNAARFDSATRPRTLPLLRRLRERAARGEALDPRLSSNLAVEIAVAGEEREEAVAHARRALADAELMAAEATPTVPQAISVLAHAQLTDEAGRAAEGWLRMAQRRGSRLVAAIAATVCSLIALQCGALDDAIGFARDALSASIEGWIPPMGVALLVEALAARGEVEAASRELSSRGLESELPAAWPFTVVRYVRGRLRAARGDHHHAVPDLLWAGELCRACGLLNPAFVAWRSSAAASLTALGRRDEALQLAREELDAAERWGTDRAIGIALRALGTAQPEAQGIATLRQAALTLERSTSPLEHAGALVDLGSALRRSGERGEAREHLRHGLDIARQHGALGLAERARAELVVAGARPRRDALRGRDALTAGELRVARMAASGLTNRQIAQALYVTPRTVELHLTNCYAKLGIASRRQLGEALGD